MDIIKKKFGECLKEIRKIKNVTQEKLAESVGINLRQLARIEAGESFITSETLYKICLALDIYPFELFNFDIFEQHLTTSKNNIVYLNAINYNGDFKISSKNKFNNVKNDDFNNLIKQLDKKMLASSKRLKKEIVVDGFNEGILICTKKYRPDGGVEVLEKEIKNDYESLKKNINKISNDNKKIEFLNLAYKALTRPEALAELKILIKGIELTQEL